MPTLDWIGKKAVLNHHRQVPYHLLKHEPDLSVGGMVLRHGRGSENLTAE